MDKDKIIAKIRKLLSLAQSNNVNEAALALKRAHDILDKYHLTLEEISKEKAIIKPTLKKSNQANWEMEIGITIGEYYDCDYQFESTFMSKDERYKWRLLFIGSETNTSIANYAYEYVLRIFNKLQTEYKKKFQSSYHYCCKLTRSQQIRYTKKKLKEYRLGFTIGLRIALVKSKPDSNVAKDNEINITDKPKKKAKNKPLSREFLTGFSEGRKVNIKTAIEQEEDEPFLIQSSKKDN
ncbi:MAG: DUF2786 domain-containing protein [Spirochaetes bacterium]|nr:DUF2786 domain-containing protein [Spirochaetota bacterium]